MDFISKNHVPMNKKVTCENMVCDIRSYKDDKHRARLMVREDTLD